MTGPQAAPPSHDDERPDRPTAARAVSALLSSMLGELSRRPDAARPNGRQLGALLRAGRAEADRIALGDPPTPGATLWRLDGPGSLRDAADRVVRRASTVAVLVPVLLTWLLLGAAEAYYARQHAATAPGLRPSFFADWMSAPAWRGPAALSALIVLSLGLIMLSYARAARDQRAADDLDRWAQEQGTTLVVPLERLRSAVAAADSTDRSGRALTQAAHRMEAAATSLAGSRGVVDQLGRTLAGLASSVGELSRAVPELGRQSAALGETDMRLRAAAADLDRRAAPLVEAVHTVESAAEAARAAGHDAGRARDEAADLADRTAELAERAEHFRSALAEARAPVTAAGETMTSTSDRLAETATTLATTAADLRAVVRRVNWLGLVADGLRHPDDAPGHDDPDHDAPERDAPHHDTPGPDGNGSRPAPAARPGRPAEEPR